MNDEEANKYVRCLDDCASDMLGIVYFHCLTQGAADIKAMEALGSLIFVREQTIWKLPSDMIPAVGSIYDRAVNRLCEKVSAVIEDNEQCDPRLKDVQQLLRSAVGTHDSEPAPRTDPETDDIEEEEEES